MTKGTKTTKTSDATTTPSDQGITLPVSMLRDRRLSPETRGALAFALTQPDRRRFPELLLAHGIGKSRVFRMVRELKAAGYLTVRSPRKLPDGTQTGWWYDVSDRPGALSTGG